MTIATQVSIRIMDAFVAMHKYISNNLIEQKIINNIVYHCGSSINHAGSKTFSINILDDNIVKDNLIDNITNLINK